MTELSEIREILAATAQQQAEAQRRSDERLSRIEAMQERTQQQIDANAVGIRETRESLEASINDVVSMISQGAAESKQLTDSTARSVAANSDAIGGMTQQLNGIVPMMRQLFDNLFNRLAHIEGLIRELGTSEGNGHGNGNGGGD